MSILISEHLASVINITSRPLYLVGGSVRDLLSGTEDISDIDVLMQGGSEAAARTFADIIGGSFFFLDEERRITRVVKHEAGAVLQFDFSDFAGPDLHADLSRRDFTINAMALDLRDYLKTASLESVIDPFGGRADLAKKLIRAVRPEALEEDPLRMLRAVRFSACLTSAIAPSTADAIRQRAHLITLPSPERLRDELFQILALRGAERHLSLMDSLGLLLPLFPELAPLKGFMPGRYLDHDVLTHSLKTVGYLDTLFDDLHRLSPEHGARVLAHLDEPMEQHVTRAGALRFACLLHDIAKPETFTEVDGHVRFHGHDTRGAEQAKETCRRFRLSRDAEAAVTKVIKYHMRLFNLATPDGPSRNAVYRYCRDLNADLPESLLLAQADARATYEIMAKNKFTDTEQPMTAVLDFYYNRFLKTEEAPLISGQDLIDLGLAPGPRFREILDEVKEQQAAGVIRNREEALDYLNKFKYRN